MEQRQHAHGDHHVVRQRDNHARRQTPLKAEPNVDKDRDQRDQQRHRAGLRQFRAHARADKLNTLHHGILAGRIVNHANDLATQNLSAGCAFRRRHTHHDVAAAAEVLQQRIFKARFYQRFTHQIHISRFFQRNFNDRTTGKVEPPVKALYANDNKRGDKQQT